MTMTTDRVHAHHLSLLELLAADEVAAEGGRHLGHDGGVVTLHGVIPRLRQVSAEPQDRHPQRLSRLQPQLKLCRGINNSYYFLSLKNLFHA